jgi:ATP-dependent Lhr-like helicase
VIGTLPAGRPVAEGQFVIFGGKRWEVKEVISERFRIKLTPAGVGDTPQFGGSGPPVHDIVRERMCLVYRRGSAPRYLDEAGVRYFQEGQGVFNQYGLDDGSLHDYQGGSFLMIWKGDRVIDTLKYFLESKGDKVVNSGPILECPNLTAAELRERLQAVKCESEASLENIFDTVKNPALEKFDDYLTDELQCLGFASRAFDVSAMRKWLAAVS